MNDNLNNGISIRNKGKSVFLNNKVLKILFFVLIGFILTLFIFYSAISLWDKKNSFSVMVSSYGLNINDGNNNPKNGCIMLSTDANFTSPSTHINCESINGLNNISILDIPYNICDIDGEHNGEDYIALTFYLKNVGAECVISDKIIINNCYRDVDEAIRVLVYRNNDFNQYAKLNKNGECEYNTIAFYSDNYVCYNENIVTMNEVVKYTIVIWLEGDDPDCTDDLFGGHIDLSMEFNVIDN